MNLVDIYVMQSGNRDETISFASVADTNDMFRVTYKPRDGKTKAYEFQLHRSKVSDYLYDMLELLVNDMYPYDSVQVMTKHMPPVVVSMMDLEDDCTRSLIARTALAGLDCKVRVAKRNSQ